MDSRSQVLIAGGGPVGMVLAYLLGRQGITVRLVEEASTPAEDMRASTFHPSTLDIMAEIGLLDELESRGLRAPIYQYYNRATQASYLLDLGEISDVTDHPYRLQCEQFKLVEIIAKRLAAMPNVEVLRGHRLIHFEQDDDGVIVTAETSIELIRFEAEYLVGADGANSLVRKWLGVGFDGFTYPESFLTLSTSYPIERHLPWLEAVNYVADPEGWCVLLRVPSFWRVLVPIEAGEDALPSPLSDERKDAIFRHLLGPDAPQIETHHRTVYRVHQRVAKTFRVGRALLIGDAAHLNNPLGGLGMNSGIHDAWNLADKLVRILNKGERADPLLDRFNDERHAVTRNFVQAMTIGNKQSMEETESRIAQESAMAKLTNDPVARRKHLLRSAMYTSLELEALPA